MTGAWSHVTSVPEHCFESRPSRAPIQHPLCTDWLCGGDLGSSVCVARRASWQMAGVAGYQIEHDEHWSRLRAFADEAEGGLRVDGMVGRFAAALLSAEPASSWARAVSLMDVMAEYACEWPRTGRASAPGAGLGPFEAAVRALFVAGVGAVPAREEAVGVVSSVFVDGECTDAWLALSSGMPSLPPTGDKADASRAHVAVVLRVLRACASEHNYVVYFSIDVHRSYPRIVFVVHRLVEYIELRWGVGGVFASPGAHAPEYVTVFSRLTAFVLWALSIRRACTCLQSIASDLRNSLGVLPPQLRLTGPGTGDASAVVPVAADGPADTGANARLHLVTRLLGVKSAAQAGMHLYRAGSRDALMNVLARPLGRQEYRRMFPEMNDRHMQSVLQTFATDAAERAACVACIEKYSDMGWQRDVGDEVVSDSRGGAVGATGAVGTVPVGAARESAPVAPVSSVPPAVRGPSGATVDQSGGNSGRGRGGGGNVGGGGGRGSGRCVDPVSALGPRRPERRSAAVSTWKKSDLPSSAVAATEEAWCVHAWATALQQRIRIAAPLCGDPSDIMNMWFYRNVCFTPQSMCTKSSTVIWGGQRPSHAISRPYVLWLAACLWFVGCRCCGKGVVCTNVLVACAHWCMHTETCANGEICETVKLAT